MKALIIADDFTGANDTGVQLAKKGARTEVAVNPVSRVSSRVDVLVLNTESRGLTAAEATERLEQFLLPQSQHASSSDILLYKKIDSTLRGNIGAEIEATMRLMHRQVAIVAPAIPGAGRTTLHGQCLVNGVPLLETEFATDPRNPVISSRIKTLFSRQSDCPVSEIDLEHVRSGKLAMYLRALVNSSERHIVVLDAVSDDDLSRIAAAGLALTPSPLFVGAAGLAGALPSSSYRINQSHLPVLVIAGSMSEATWWQVEYLRHNPQVEMIDIDVGHLLAPDVAREMTVLAAKAIRILSAGKHCILRTCRSLDERTHIDTLCSQHQLSRQQLGETLSRYLGDLAVRIVDGARAGALFLTGGDIAAAVARALGASGYRIQGEVAPCVPWGVLINSDIDDLPVITKAGGFGSETTIQHALDFIEDMYCE
ncbi:four-carbon acid sugar kinase family protein [Erwiniaceae bacterium CAU 1747]